MKPKAKKAGSLGPVQLDLIEWLAQQPEPTESQTDAIRAALAIKPAIVSDRIEGITPPGTILDDVVSLFRRTTDFPLEIPAFITLYIVAASALDRGVRLRVTGQSVYPDLWAVCLAGSGAGKTVSVQTLRRIIAFREMPDAASSAMWHQLMLEHNRSAWFRDEFAQLMKAIETQSYMQEMRGYLLQLHDNTPIARRTKQGGDAVIDDPALVIFGTTVDETFRDCISVEAMLDGFMQRFQIVYGDRDPGRTPDMFPLYRVATDENLDPLRKAWSRIDPAAWLPEYIVKDDGEQAFERLFRDLFARFDHIPPSFFRRVMWRAFKYALVYHLILGKAAEPEIDAEDLQWAARVSAVHLGDARRLLDGYNVSKLEQLIQRAETVRDRIKKEQGRPLTTRDVIRLVRGVENANVAAFILREVQPGIPVPTPRTRRTRAGRGAHRITRKGRRAADQHRRAGR